MHEHLRAKIKTLNELMWERRFSWNDIQIWLSQYTESPDTQYSERLHALFLLSNFSYFNASLMRALLRALYRDFIQYPIIERVRRRHSDTLDWSSIEPHFQRSLSQIRFIGIGNPSESGTHLLYYFRQESNLATDLFIHPHELFNGTAAAPQLIKGIKQLVFLDDFCGSGTQAKRYSKRLLTRIREIDTRLRLSYYPLFATTAGLNFVRRKTLFTDVAALCELDDSFRSLDRGSRYFREAHQDISREFAEDFCRRYGALLEPSAPLGFGGCQLLLGFAHNIPNNSLPIFWSEGHQGHQWTALFPRYRKGVGW